MNLNLKNFLRLVAAAPLLITSSMALADDGSNTFASFQDANSLRNFVFTAGANSASFNAVADPVNFQYTVGGLMSALVGNQLAHLTMTSSTTKSAKSDDDTGYDSQAITSTMTISITRDTAIGGKSNLLTAVITKGGYNAALTGVNGGTGVGFQTATPSQNITYTSDFLNFASAGTISKSMGLSLSGLNTPLVVSGNYLASFSGNAVGTFSANPSPIALSPVPEPASYAMMFLGLGFISFKARRKSSKKTDA